MIICLISDGAKDSFTDSIRAAAPETNDAATDVPSINVSSFSGITTC
jgi:hypothetical protein